MYKEIVQLLLIFTLLLLFSTFSCTKRFWDFDWREDEKKNNEIQPPNEVMNIVGVKNGMIVGEFGASYGRYTIHLAKRVGEKGIIYANDVEKSSLEFLSKRCQKAGLKNVKTILGKYDDPLFPQESLDMAFSTLVYHEIENPVIFLKNLIPALKPNATIVIVDYDPKINREDSNINRDWKKEFDAAGLEIVKFERLPERDVIFILKLKDNQAKHQKKQTRNLQNLLKQERKVRRS